MLWRRAVSICVLLGLVHVTIQGVQGRRQEIPKLDAALKRAFDDGNGAFRVIVRTKSGFTEATARPLAARGRRIYSYHPLISGFTAGVTARDLRELAAHPDVLTLSVDAVVRPDSRINARIERSAAAVLTSRQPMPSSAGAVVAIIDSGIGPAAAADLRASFEASGGRVKAIAPRDEYGHGSRLAEVVAETAAVDQDPAAQASGARLVSFKVLDATGQGNTSDVITAIEYIAAHKDALGVQVLVLALGHQIFEPATTDPLVRTVEAAVRLGIVVVVSARNYGTAKGGEVGYAGITSPGNAPSAVTVGAMETAGAGGAGEVARYSSRGPTWYDSYVKPDVVARGAVTLAAGKETLNGTSVSAAVAAGVVARMLEAKRAPDGAAVLAPAAIKEILQGTASPLRDRRGMRYDALSQGAGAIHAAAAIRTAGSATALRTAVDQTRLPHWFKEAVWGPAAPPWARQIVWGERLIGTAVSERVAWDTVAQDGTGVVWGNLTDVGFTAIATVLSMRGER